ncbi:MAG TPA: hypothetical protein VH598_01455 [Verrucomicrobiae bacterium]|jgi:hypothetical protein|nr:hypothetical protein [Verrucomicrobiae bacterium]
MIRGWTGRSSPVEKKFNFFLASWLDLFKHGGITEINVMKICGDGGAFVAF